MGRNDPRAGRTDPARRSGRRPLHESGAWPLEVHPDPGDGAVDEPGATVETGTTVVGVAVDDAVVLAADRRASVGGGRFVTNKHVRKVEPVHPTAAAALSGGVGGIQQFVRTLRAESTLYADRRGEAMSLTALATLAGNVLRGAPLHVSPLLGGVDGDGPRLFALDGGGGVLADEYAAGGSGMQIAYGVLERRYEPGLSVAAASSVAASAVDCASERDTASGNGLTVAVVDADGVAVEEYDAAAEVAA